MVLVFKSLMFKIGIIGLGFAGRRFLRSFEYLRVVEKKDIEVIGLIDINKPKDLLSKKYPFYSNTKSFLSKCTPNVLVVATNDTTHANVFRDLKKLKNIIIFSEKPLVSNYKDCLNLETFFIKNKLFVNYVERSSPIINDLKKFVDTKQVIFEKGSFMWGKNRFFDHRSTMGVYADITHPIDLLCHIMNPKKIKIKVTDYTTCKFTQNNIEQTDTLNIKLVLDSCNIMGQSSYVWSERIRKIILFAVSKKFKNREYQIFLTFDKPLWDCDHIQINEYNTKTFCSKLILDKKYPGKGYISEMTQLNKVLSFVKDILFSGALNKNSVSCDYYQAKRDVQLIEKLKNQSKKLKH
jgi:hypothetical protein